MAKPNYSFEKRQRELAKKKKEEKASRKSHPAPEAAPDEQRPGDNQAAPAAPGEGNGPA